MKEYKVGIEAYSDVRYKGEEIEINNSYWTTVMAESERQAKLLAMKNLCVKIAQKEIFTWGNVKQWVNIQIDLSDMVIGE